jgi:glycosyltransferase involved in cell wall biosynthesis
MRLCARSMHLNSAVRTLFTQSGCRKYIAPLVERLTVPYDVTFTDYHHFSDTPHFEDKSGHFIGDAAVAAIQQTARDNVPPLLRNAERRIALSGDLARRIEGFMPGSPVIPARVSEADTAIKAPVKIVRLAGGEVMRVLVLGRPHPVKGSATILEVARRTQQENFPMEITCLGEIHQGAADLLSSLPAVRLLGAYAQTDLPTIIARLKPHLAWLPFSVPETHSYALSDVMSLGLPVLASAIGAVPERVVGRQSTWLVPVDGADANSHFRWLERLYHDRLQTPASCLPVDHLPRVVERFYPEAYLDPLLKSRWALLRWLHRLVH